MEMRTKTVLPNFRCCGPATGVQDLHRRLHQTLPGQEDRRGRRCVEIDVLPNRCTLQTCPTFAHACTGFEARGFIFGAPLALALNCAFVPLRKPGKLPGLGPLVLPASKCMQCIHDCVRPSSWLLAPCWAMVDQMRSSLVSMLLCCSSACISACGYNLPMPNRRDHRRQLQAGVWRGPHRDAQGARDCGATGGAH